jgi:hypothetical protein
MRKRRRRTKTAMAQQLQPQQHRSIHYNPSHSEWTLFFFGSSSNLKLFTISSSFAEFCQNHPDKVQCIGVPNGNDEDLLPLGTGFYLLPWDHSNRSALLHLLAVTRIPTLVVVSNHDDVVSPTAVSLPLNLRNTQPLQLISLNDGVNKARDMDSNRCFWKVVL